jgi:hypothetical protein
VFRRAAVRQRACCCSPVLKPLQVCPHDPPLLPRPPGEAPPRAAPAPPQAGHKRRRPAARPCPGWPTAAALLTADPCKSARAAGTPPLLPLPPGEVLLRAAHAPPQAGHRRSHPVARERIVRTSSRPPFRRCALELERCLSAGAHSPHLPLPSVTVCHTVSRFSLSSLRGKSWPYGC